MKIGKFTIAKWKWYYDNQELKNPIAIAWGLLWTPPIFALGWLLYFALLIGRGNYWADEFRRHYL